MRKNIINSITFIFLSMTNMYLFSDNHTLPVINTDIVNIRDYPSIIHGDIISQAKKNQPIYIDYKVIDKDEINGKESNWYYIHYNSPNGIIISGWLFGQFITFWENEYIYNESINIIKEIYLKSLSKYLFVKEVLGLLIGKSKKGVFPLSYLKKYKKITSKEYPSNSIPKNGFNFLNEYSDKSILIYAFVNNENNLFYLYFLQVSKKLPIHPEIIGLSISEIEKLFGNYSNISNELIEFDYNSLPFDSHKLQVHYTNGIIDSYSIHMYVD